MLKEIHYTGLSTTPSGYDAPDGALTASINLINDNGILAPICSPATVCSKFNSGQQLQYIHHLIGSNRQIYIYTSTNTGTTLYYAQSSTPDADTTLCHISEGSLIQITAIGNTLVILTSAGMIYALWNPETQSYSVMPATIPDLPLRFSLYGDECRSPVTINLDSKITDTNSPFSNENSRRISDTAIGHINSILANAAQSGHFVLPFFARYAFRLYDGSIVGHSAPILLRPVIGPTFVASMVYPTQDTSRLTYIQHPLTKLKWQLDATAGSSHELINALKPYADIISSIDIFVSSPLYDFDINGSITQFDNSHTHARYHTFRYEGSAPTRVTEYDAISGMHTAPSTLGFGLKLPPLDDKESLTARAAATANFYLVKSIPFSKLESTQFISNDDIAPDILSALATREAMSDDYGAGDTLCPSHAYTYNARLNIADITKVINPRTHIPLAIQRIGATNPTETAAHYSARAFIFVRRDDRRFTVASEIFEFEQADQLSWFYHHCPGAYRLLVVRRPSGTEQWQQFLDMPLAPHEFLNGAFYCADNLDTLLQWHAITDHSIIPDTVDRQIIETAHNKIYVSDVNNPFNFPTTAVTTVGSGTIMALSSAAKPLSTGQFGQFPLYAFTSDGIWALEVSSTGKYSARQPITRDVCTNPNGIAQLDTSVAFPSARGIMILSGSQTHTITDNIDADRPFNILTLPHMDTLHKMLGPTHDDDCIPLQSFPKFLLSCRLLYDYVHQRIIAFTPATTRRRYALVYSLRTGMWGMIQSPILHTVNSYPEAYAVTFNNLLVDYSSGNIPAPALLVTRPLKLDAPDILKTVDTIIQRGNFARGHVASVIYGSRDLDNWHIVHSSRDHILRGFRGTPYKYFRIALICNLDPGETITGCTIQYTPRLTNQPR